MVTYDVVAAVGSVFCTDEIGCSSDDVMLYIGCSLSVKTCYGYIYSDYRGGIECFLFFSADFVIL